MNEVQVAFKGFLDGLVPLVIAEPFEAAGIRASAVRYQDVQMIEFFIVPELNAHNLLVL